MAESLEEQTRRALQQLQELHQSSKPQPPTPEPLSPAPPQQSLLRFLRLDSDALLILPLLLLLSREGADAALLLALVYVLL